MGRGQAWAASVFCHVRQTLSAARELGDVKSDRSDRHLALDRALVDMLIEQRVSREVAELTNESWANPLDLVFTDPAGGPIAPRGCLPLATHCQRPNHP